MADDAMSSQRVFDLGTQASKEVGEYILTIESLTEEKKQVGEKIKAEFAELASSGYDKLAIKQIIKDRAADAQKSVELRAVTAAYRRAVAGLANSAVGDWARSWLAQEARINKPASEESPQMAEFLKGRKAKADDGDDARAA